MRNKNIMNPFFVMIIIYIIIAIVEAIQVVMTQLFHTSYLVNFIWFRIHFITIGILTQAIFGAVPLVLSWRKNIQNETNWLVWTLLNAGLGALIIGFSQTNEFFIYTGGTLIFVATFLLIFDIIKLLQVNSEKLLSTVNLFYITGLIYLFIGIIIGVSMYTSFSGFWNNKAPLETHIHANSWGFLSLVFTGLIIDYFPVFFKDKLLSDKMEKIIYSFMTIGALGLVIGPWTGILYILVPGLLLHVTGTVLLLYYLINYVLKTNLTRNIGLLHFISAYAWLIAPLLVSPFVIFKVPGFDYVEANAPEALIYGWALMVGVAIIPYFINKYFVPTGKVTLGGNWVTLVFLHLGSIVLWISIFTQGSPVIHGTAYILWIIALAAFFFEVYSLITKYDNSESEQKVVQV